MDLNNYGSAFPDGNQGRIPPQYHQGSSNPYGIRQPSIIPSEFRDSFGTPYSSSSAYMTGETPQTQDTTHQGAMTQSPGSMPAQFSDVTGNEQLASHEGTRPRTDSENAETNSEEPAKKKKKGKNGEAVGAGNGSGAEDKDKEKEKEKDNRRKT
jgi:hypothetical protein